MKPKPTTANLQGTDAELFEMCCEHLRAVAPISVGGLEFWMIEQVPGVNATNAARVCRAFLAEAKKRKLLEVCADGCIELRCNTCGSTKTRDPATGGCDKCDDL